MKKLLFVLCFSFLFTASEDALAKTRMIKGKLYFSSNKCLILKTVTGRKYNLKNYGALEADQRVKLQVEDVPKGEIDCDGPGKGVNVLKVVKTYPHSTHAKKDSTRVTK
jgi:hypothetical protein